MAVTHAVDYYRVLQVDPDAEPEVIAAAYRRLAAKYHPDVNGSSPEANTRMQELNAAYNVLSDADRRAAYDQARGARWIPPFVGGARQPQGPQTARSMVEQFARAIVIMILWSVAFTFLGRMFGGNGGMAVALILVVALLLWKGGALMKYFGGRSR